MLDYQGVLQQQEILQSWAGALQWRGAALALAADGSPEAAAVLAMQYTGWSLRAQGAILDEAMRGLRDGPGVVAAWACWLEQRVDRLAQALSGRPPHLPCPIRLYVRANLKCGRLVELQSRPLRDVVDELVAAASDADNDVAERAGTVLEGLANHAVTATQLALACTKERVSSVVRPALDAVRSPEAIDAVCGIWQRTRHPRLTHLITQRRWLPTEPASLRVLAALKFQPDQVPTTAATGLLKACWDADVDIRRRAERALLGRSDAPGQEAVCLAVLEVEGPPAIMRSLAEQPWHPAEPAPRAVYFLLTGQYDKALDLDFDLAMLSHAYRHEAPALRRRLAAAIRRSARSDLTRILIRQQSDDHQHLLLPELEWETVLTALDSPERASDLWSLALDAPPRWSVQALLRLMAHRFQPAEPDRPLWHKLTALHRELQRPVDWSFVEQSQDPETTTLTDLPLGTIPPAVALSRLVAFANGPDITVVDGARAVHLHSAVAPFWLGWNADGTRLAAASSIAVDVWDVLNQRCEVHMSYPESDRFAWSADGSWLVAQNSMGYRTCCDLRRGRSAAMSEARSFDSVALSADGRLMAVVRSSEWRLYEVDLDRAVDAFALRQVATMQSGARSASFSPDGGTLAIVSASARSKSNGLTCWNTLTGERGLFIDGGIFHPVWSADGRFVVLEREVGRDQHTVEVWDMVDGMQRYRLVVPAAFRQAGAHSTAWLTALWMAPDNQCVTALTRNGRRLCYSLCPTPLAAMHLRTWEAQERRAQDPGHIGWQFLAAMLEYRSRYDIEIEEDSFVPDAFDIELET